MYATIQKWGNSQGLRIPKPLLDALDIHENDRVELLSDHDSITVRKVSSPALKTLEERLTAYYGKPLDQIGPVETDGETDWGSAKGDEVW